MTEELITVIIPCFQQGRFLGECIKSLQVQTYTNWEAIIVNDGSTDNTEIIGSELNRNDSRVHYIYQENRGVSSARNAAISVARGKFIQFLDPDDKLEFNKLKFQVDFLYSNSHFDAVYGSTLYFSDNEQDIFRHTFQEGIPDGDCVDEAELDQRPLLEKILERNIFSICSPIFRKSLIDRVGSFDESLSRHEDWDYFLRAAMDGMKLVYLPGENSNVFVRTHSASLSQDRTAMAESMLVVRLKIHSVLQRTLEKRKNIVNMIGLLSAVNQENVSKFKYEIYSACTSRNEKFFFSVLYLVSIDGPFFFLVRRLVPLFPLPLLRFLGISKSAAQALNSIK